MTKHSLRLSILAGVMVLAAVAGAGLAHLFSSGKGTGTAFAEDAIAFPNVKLVDQKGTEHHLLEDITAGSLVVVNFNYTTCESICPAGNVLMQALDRQAPPALSKPVKLLSITIDPRTDTPKVMRKAAEEFEPSERWLWLTGEPRDVVSVLKSAGADVPDVTLHAPLFLVGDTDSGRFYTIRAQPDTDQVIDVLSRLDS